ncbi:cytochrome C oxidase subunit II [Oceanobacillus alkalisoli]|uniref:cytochrome C oxidase subunit II n=1 Tax=Oceanobacillus alkalisoli TaxID=2925113 RepID=UPI001EF12392|nr:cytochrome C oxidase subunit II [Oceanobacillus alkalisoli]MCF3942274.1 cytochrome C oxidase subunit II [Oceanobacillus alkalisoli]MCG5104510.1 cytochrome C oxidase subunit II [Oceanobacillus alkalisoli]
MKRSILVTLILSLILVLAACGGDDNSSTTDNDGDNSTEETESTSSSEETTFNEIEIQASNFELDLSETTVTAGEEVKLSLTNVEGMHGISIDELDVSVEGDGEAVFTPEEPGEYTIYCNIPCGQGHSDMVAKLIVQ